MLCALAPAMAAGDVKGRGGLQSASMIDGRAPRKQRLHHLEATIHACREQRRPAAAPRVSSAVDRYLNK